MREKAAATIVCYICDKFMVMNIIKAKMNSKNQSLYYIADSYKSLSITMTNLNGNGKFDSFPIKVLSVDAGTTHKYL